jgi:hypothetical protein
MLLDADRKHNIYESSRNVLGGWQLLQNSPHGNVYSDPIVFPHHQSTEKVIFLNTVSTACESF